jgi:hypothetical protein
MAACPVTPSPLSNLRRRPLTLTPRRIEANRRNAARSTGPRTPEGKARVARNPIKHGFFVAQERWTSAQRRDFVETLDGLRADLNPQGAVEERCVTTIAASYVRMAAMLRYESIAALKHHQQCDRELNERIAAADAPEAARLEAQRDNLRRAGLWCPTIPGPREANAIIRYEGRLNRAIRHASAELHASKKMRIGGVSSMLKVQKQTHYSASPNGVLRPGEEPQVATSAEAKDAKTNPLSSMFTGNRHERRRAKALAARRDRRRPSP